MARLGRLPRDALEVARAVAVLGSEAHLRHAAAMAGITIDAAGAAADVLLRAEILGPERPLSFVHPLVASAVYNDLLPGDRSARHRRAAEVLMAERTPPDRMARHYIASEPAGDRAVVEVLAASAAPRWPKGRPTLRSRNSAEPSSSQGQSNISAKRSRAFPTCGPESC